MFVDAVRSSEVEGRDDRRQLDGHLDELGLFSLALGVKDQIVFKKDVSLDVVAKLVWLIQLHRLS